MKKRIMALMLCAVLMTSLLCVNVFAMADKTKVISIDNIYDIVYGENPSITITGNSLYLSSMSAAGTIIQSYTTGASTLSSKQSQKKIAYNSQQTLLSYYTSLNSVEKLKDQVKAMETTVAIAKVKLDNGLISLVDYNSTLISQKNLQTSLLTAQESLKTAKGNLNLLVNNTYDDEINIADFAPMDITLIDSLDKDACYTDAVNNSMDLAAAKLRLDGAIENDEMRETTTTSVTRDSAYITYTTAQKTLDQTFDSQWNSLLQKKDALAIQEISFQSDEATYQLNILKYDMGMISKVDYDTAVQNYEASKISLQNAQISLYQAYKKFLALVAGVSL